MGEFLDRANIVFEDGPSNAPGQPSKLGQRSLWSLVDTTFSSIVLAIAAGTATVKLNKAALDGDLAHDAGTLGIALNGVDAGIYLKDGASGVGTWDPTDLALPSTFADDLAGKQPVNANLTDLAALTFAANKILHLNGSGELALADITADGYALLASDDANAFTDALLAKLDALPSAATLASDLAGKQALNANLTALAGLSITADGYALLESADANAFTDALRAKLNALPTAATLADDLAGKQEVAANLTDLAALVFEANRILHIDNGGDLAMTPVTDAAYALLAAEDSLAFTAALREKLTSLLTTTQINARLAAKVDTNTYLTGMARKADTVTVNKALDKKADKADLANVSRDAGDFLQDRFGTQPGAAPHLFTSSLDGGDVHALPMLGAPQTFGSEGPVAYLDEAGIVAMRTTFPVEPGRRYHARATVRRTIDSPDPDNDGVRFGIAWYDQTGNRMAGASAFSVVGSDILGLTVAQGAVERRGIVARAEGATVDVIAPYGAVGARPYVQRYGSGGRLYVKAIGWQDVTDSRLWSPDVADLQAEIDAISSQDLGARVGVLEAEAATPSQAGYISTTDLAAATPAASAEVIQRLGFSFPGDGGHSQLARVPALPAHGGKWPAADGSTWELTGPIIELRQLGPCFPDTDPKIVAETLRKAQSFMVEKRFRVMLPPWEMTVDAPDDTKVADGEGAILIIDHANNAPIYFLGQPGASVIKPATNRIELFAVVGDGDVTLEGIDFDNSDNGILQYQVKTNLKSPNGGIAANGNQANCVVRQYEGTGRVTIRNCIAREFYCLHQHFGSLEDENILVGEIVHERNKIYGGAFAALYTRPELVKISDCDAFGMVDGLNGNNTDGSQTDTTIVSRDPGHYQYKSDRYGIRPRIQQVSGFRAQDCSSSPLKVRGANMASHTDFTIEDCGRGAELLYCQNSMMANGRVSLSQAQIGTDSQANAFGFTNTAASQAIGCIADIRDTDAFGLRVGDNDEERAEIASISKAAQGVVTTLAALPDRFEVGNVIGFYSMVGMTELDEQTATIVARTASTFTINIDTSGFGDFVSGFASNTPWANKGNSIFGMKIYQNFSVVGAKAPYMMEDQRDSELLFPTLYQDGDNASRNVIEFKRCRDCLILMPRKYCSPVVEFADRLVVLEDCFNCTVIYDESAIPVPITTDTVRDNNPAGNNRIWRISGDDRLVRASAGSEAETAFGYFNEPGLGFHRVGSGVEGWSTGGYRRLRFFGDRLEPEADAATAMSPLAPYNLGTAAKAFDRVHLRTLALDASMALSAPTPGRVMIQWDQPNNRLMLNTDGQNYEFVLNPVA